MEKSLQVSDRVLLPFLAFQCICIKDTDGSLICQLMCSVREQFYC